MHARGLTAELLHLLLPAAHLALGALLDLVDALQLGPVLAEGCLHLQLLLNGCVSCLSPVALHFRSCAVGALQPPRRIFQFLQLALQPLKARLSLYTATG